MTKADVIKYAAANVDCSKKLAGVIVEQAFVAIQSSLVRGEKVYIDGFGSFKAVERAERKGAHPQTGAAITIPATKAVKFTPAKALKDAVKA